MRKTLLLVYIHGFKGSDTTFKQYPYDLQKLVQRELPRVEVVSKQYPQFETRGDLLACIVRFREWLHDLVMEYEAKNDAPSPVLDPSVHTILIGHSMGGIVAAETLLSIVGDPAAMSIRTPLATPVEKTEASGGLGASSPREYPPAFYPHIRAILALDTPFLGISPSVVAYGAEDGWKKAGEAWMAVTQTSEKMGFTSSQPAATSARGGSSSAWTVLGKVAMYTGGAAALATAAGVAMYNWKHLSEGMKWVTSHLEFISCLGRGIELKTRLEALVKITEDRGIGFAEFYVALGKEQDRVSNYPASGVDTTRTFVYIPKNISEDISASVGAKPSGPPPAASTADEHVPHVSDEMKDGDKVEEFANDMTKSKGRWVKCVNTMAGDELTAHRTMFIASRNPDYYTFLLPQNRDQIVYWVDRKWYETSEYRTDVPEEPQDLDMSDAEDFDLD